jgi:integrase
MAKILIGQYEGTIYPDGNGYRGAIDLGFDAKGKRQRVKRRGKTKALVKDKLREAVADLEVGVTTDAKYTVKDAVTDFLARGLKGRSKETIKNYRSLAEGNVVPQLGEIKLKELTADHLDDWLDERAEELSTRTLRLIHSILERAIRQAQARDKVRRNVASLVDVPEGQEGRPSKAMTLNQAVMLLETVEAGTHRLAAYVVLSLLSGVRTEEARALQWGEVDLEAGTVAVYRSVRVKGDTKTRKSRRVLELPTQAVQALRAHHTRPGRRTARSGGDVARTRPRVLPRRRHPTRPLARTKGVPEDHQGRQTRRRVDTPRATPLVRIHPQCPRCPPRGHQRSGGPQQHVGNRDRVPP